MKWLPIYILIGVSIGLVCGKITANQTQFAQGIIFAGGGFILVIIGAVFIWAGLTGKIY